MPFLHLSGLYDYISQYDLILTVIFSFILNQMAP